MKIKLYIPICGPKSGKGSWYRVNGSTSRDRDEAIKLASQHTGIKSGRDEIKRVDEEEVDEDELDRIY